MDLDSKIQEVERAASILLVSDFCYIANELLIIYEKRITKHNYNLYRIHTK